MLFRSVYRSSASTRVPRSELIAGGGASDRSPNQPAPAQREPREHVLALVALHVRCGSGSVARSLLRQAPDPHRCATSFGAPSVLPLHGFNTSPASRYASQSVRTHREVPPFGGSRQLSLIAIVSDADSISRCRQKPLPESHVGVGASSPTRRSTKPPSSPMHGGSERRAGPRIWCIAGSPSWR